MRYEDRCQATRRCRDVICDQRKYAMHTEYDLIRWTGFRIEEQIITGISKRSAGKILVDLLPRGQWHNRVIGQSTGIEKDRAQRGESATQQCTPEHDLAVVLIDHKTPIVLNVTHALSECRATRSEIAVLDCGSQAETDRSEQLNSDVEILCTKQSVYSGRYQNEAQYRQTRNDQRDRNDPLLLRRAIVDHVPDADRFQDPAT